MMGDYILGLMHESFLYHNHKFRKKKLTLKHFCTFLDNFPVNMCIEMVSAYEDI